MMAGMSERQARRMKVLRVSSLGKGACMSYVFVDLRVWWAAGAPLAVFSKSRPWCPEVSSGHGGGEATTRTRHPTTDLSLLWLELSAINRINQILAASRL